MAAGLSNWQFGRFDIYKVNPPLVRMIAAGPVLVIGANLDWHNLQTHPAGRSEFALGEDFIAANGPTSFWLFTIARWACIPFSLLGAYTCFHCARRFYGAKGGFLALLLWCSSPNILAHGQLVTCDVAAASFGFIAWYVFWQWLKEKTWGYAALSGLMLGVAELTKMTLLVFFPLWFLIWVLYRLPDRGRLLVHDWLREFGMLVLQMVIAVYVINVGYEFDGTGTRLRDFRFISTALGAENNALAHSEKGNRFADTWLGLLPMPLPKEYILGIDEQNRDFEDYGEPSYLHGQFSEHGWWYYYLYALAIKVPLGNWLLIGLAAVLGSRPNLCICLRDEFALLCPAIVIFGFVSAETGFSQHMRYVLPAFPFAIVWIGRATAVINRRAMLATALVSLALTWSVASSLWIYPHSLSYFNELAGGPVGGTRYLIHSNVDWGQDLLILKHWIDQHPEAKPLKLMYYGYFDPCYAGIRYTAPEILTTEDRGKPSQVSIPPGWYAISVNFLRGVQTFTYTGSGTKSGVSQKLVAAFQKMKPAAMAGYSIYIYQVN